MFVLIKNAPCTSTAPNRNDFPCLAWKNLHLHRPDLVCEWEQIPATGCTSGACTGVHIPAGMKLFILITGKLWVLNHSISNKRVKSSVSYFCPKRLKKEQKTIINLFKINRKHPAAFTTDVIMRSNVKCNDVSVQVSWRWGSYEVQYH